jgi:hypothetical protein
MNDLSIPIDKIARLIRNFDRQQKAKLLQLVPELQTIRPEEADIPTEQIELMDYFQAKIEALPVQKPLQDDDLFLGEMTVAEFFDLPEAGQDRLWQEAHQAVEHELDNDEHPIRSDALPAR